MISDFFKPKPKRQKKDQGKSEAELSAASSSSGRSAGGKPGEETDDACFTAETRKELSPEQLASIQAKKKAALLKRTMLALGANEVKDPEWRSILQAECAKTYAQNLGNFVQGERSASTPVFPPRDLVFAALSACPLEDIKVVIVGQDPYHGPGQAHGLSFSIAAGAVCKFPPSLRNIFKEVAADGTSIPKTGGDLTPWAQRGVLLLNSCLTVRQGQPNSHQNRGWETLTSAIIRAVGRKEGKGCVFLLWGKPALLKCKGICTKKHRIITTSHPSPLSNTKTDAPFTGSLCFSRANKLLVEELGHDAGIDWSLA